MTSKQDDQPVTKKDLEIALETLGQRLTKGIVTQLRGEMKEQGANIVTQLRGEMQEQGKQLRREMKEQGEELRGEMREQGEQLHGEIKQQRVGIVNQLRGEMRAMEERMTDNFRQELDSKLTATETHLKDHTEEIVGHYNAELLENMSDIIQPLQTQIADHGRRLSLLESTSA